MSGTLYVWAQQIELPAIETQTEVTIVTSGSTLSFEQINPIYPYESVANDIPVLLLESFVSNPVQIGLSDNGSVSGVGTWYDLTTFSQTGGGEYATLHFLVNNVGTVGQTITAIARFTEFPEITIASNSVVVTNEAIDQTGTLEPYWIATGHSGTNTVAATGATPTGAEFPAAILLSTLGNLGTITSEMTYTNGSTTISSGVITGGAAEAFCSAEGDVYGYAFGNVFIPGSETIRPTGTITGSFSTGDTVTFSGSSL